MADQAQGLRALVHRARQDHAEDSFPAVSLSGDIALADSDTEETPCRADVLNPQSQHQEVVATRATISQSYSSLRQIEIGTAAVAIRERAPAHSSVPLNSNHHDVPGNAAAAPSNKPAPRRVARVVAITSGKGGVGKTNFSSNLAITLASRGQRVILVDADLGLANVHVVLGIMPRYHLEHVMQGEKTLKEVLYPGPGGIHIIGGGSGLTELANLDENRRTLFIQSLSELDTLADVVLLDTGAGLSHNVLGFLCAVDEVIVVTTPEPTAITDAYATIKVLSQENVRANLRLVINMAQSETEAQAAAQRLQGIARRFLQRELDCLGYLPHDPAVSKAVRAQQPFTLFQPNAPAARAIAQIAARLGYDQQPIPSPTAGVSGLLTRMSRFFKIQA